MFFVDLMGFLSVLLRFLVFVMVLWSSLVMASLFQLLIPSSAKASLLAPEEHSFQANKHHAQPLMIFQALRQS